eukprot:779247-Alexandrium_andersonii.AAC.1
MSASLVGSEMCIRDSPGPSRLAPPARAASPGGHRPPDPPEKRLPARRGRFCRAGGTFRGRPGGRWPPW